MDVLTLAEEDTQLHRAARGEYAGPCPGCGGTNRFRVRCSSDTGEWRFMCRYCYDAAQFVPEKGKKRGWGDVIDYLRHYRNMSFKEAQAMAGERQQTPYQTAQPRYLSADWQKSVHLAMEEHRARLWGDDTLALQYARHRGLYDHTIKQFQLGYSIYRGIPYLVIPSINEGCYVTIYRRDLRGDKPEDAPRWKDVAGGAKNELYLADCLHSRSSLPVVLCEDAFSALSVYQECGDIVNVVATGGVDCCMTTKWIAQLACMPLVLVALDADPAGDKHAIEWLKRLKNGRRLRPLLKDANDMLIDGWNIREWIQEAVQERCSVCGVDIDNPAHEFFYDERGVLYCDQHYTVQ